ncbi:DUF952 domain-containing protein [Streptomyces sp. A7024]|uniref:DUF952 domain-containing protein n=1 Tax=Streptomyces coryli TaxID=1128680 RepID=A0A6G4U7R7_9ACTN|nr:DUF952 domain-containing protein [Streptomyces coryli]NGN67756.1 DUF952 domain-containing protein [Streptomyces coryli]
MIYHVVPLDDWLLAPDRPYAPPHLSEIGFVHCSPDEATSLTVADTAYRDTRGPLMVLMIDEHALDARIRWEPADPTPPPGVPADTLFPHVYGRINRTAVAGMLEVRRDAQGRAVELAVWS